MQKRVTAMSTRIFVPLVVSMMLLTLCCACGEGGTPESETADSLDVKTFKTDAYTIVLPENITAKEGDDGNTILFLDYVEIGGIAVIPYENAGQLSMEEAQTEEGEKKFDDLLNLIIPERKAGYMFSSHLTETQDTFCLSVAPWPEEETPATIHYFFPQGDMFYDLYFLEVLVPAEKSQVMLDSFTLVQ